MAANAQPTSGLKFNKTFGGQQAAPEQKPAAQFWINIGYDSGVKLNDEDATTAFVSLPMGIPLDTMEPVKVQSKNAGYAQFMSAKNDLRDQILKAVEALEPGGETYLDLKVQVRRVAAPQGAVDPATNVFAHKLTLA